MNLKGKQRYALDRAIRSILISHGRLALLGAQSGLLMLMSLGTAYAADAEATSAATASNETSGEALEEIVVTARRRSELLQDVPQTVTAVSPTELQQLNLQNLSDLSAVVPSLQITANPNRSLDSNTFRGVSFQPATGTQNTLGFYINDTFVTNNFVTDSNFDIGQIELLSGPQGTLRGEPAPSGSLTITTRRPDMEQFGGYLNLTATNLDNTNENGAVNLPIIKDMLAIRLAGVAEDTDLDGVKSVNNLTAPLYHNYAERASLRFEPIDAIEANVMYQHEYYHQDQFAQVTGTGAPGGTFTPSPGSYPAAAVIPPNYNGPPITPGERLGVQTYPTVQYDMEDLVTGQLDWHVLGQIVSYDGSYWSYANNGGDIALPANQVPGITAADPIPRQSYQFNTPSIDEHVQTDELRVASETPILGFMDYTVGAFYKHTKDAVAVVQLASFLPGSFGPGPAANPNIYSSDFTLQIGVNSPKEEKEASEFAHLTFHLPFDTELAAGGRYINYRTDGYNVGTLLPDGVFAGAALPASICNAIGGKFGITYPGFCDIPATSPLVLGPQKQGSGLPLKSFDFTDHPWIYNVSLSHKVTQQLLVYVDGGSSWRPPGPVVGIFNAANNPTLNSLLTFKSEKSTDVEAGFKWTFFEDRARLNVAYYHQSFTNFIYYGLPVLYLEDNGSGTNSVQPFAFTSNPDAVVNGVDLDSQFRFTRQWSFGLKANYTNGHLTGSSVPCSPPSGGTTAAAFPANTYIFLCPSHASTSVAPNFNATATSEYDLPLPGATGIDSFIRGLYTFSGRNPHVDTVFVAPSYGLLNLYAGLHSSDGAWEAALFAKNALNTQKTLDISYSAGQINTAGLSSLFGASGYYSSPNGPMVTPRAEYGLTITYAIGSR